MDSLLVKWIVRFIRANKFAGLLFLLLVVEVVCVAIYVPGEVNKAKNTGEPVVITDVATEWMVNDEGETGYCFLVTVLNQGSTTQKARIACNLGNGKYLAMEQISEYQDLKVTDPWYQRIDSDNTIPAGTRTTLQFFIKQEKLESVTAEQLTFQDSFRV